MVLIKLVSFIGLAYLFGKGFAMSYQQDIKDVEKQKEELKNEVEYAHFIFKNHKKALIKTIEEQQEHIRQIQNDLDSANYLLNAKELKND